jgi:uridine kinase
LLQEKYSRYYDYKIWVDCSFETGMKRAIERNTEKLDETRLIHDYNTYYYPAQTLHFKKDNPMNAADFVFDNNY